MKRLNGIVPIPPLMCDLVPRRRYDVISRLSGNRLASIFTRMRGGRRRKILCFLVSPVEADGASGRRVCKARSRSEIISDNAGEIEINVVIW